jgi:hypothetical protein
VHVIDRARRVRDLGPFRGRSPQKGFDVGGDGRHGQGKIGDPEKVDDAGTQVTSCEVEGREVKMGALERFAF